MKKSRQIETEYDIQIERVLIRRRRLMAESVETGTQGVAPRIIDGTAPLVAMTARPTAPRFRPEPVARAALPPPSPASDPEALPVDLFALLDRVGDIRPMTAVLGATGINGDGGPLLLRLGASDVGHALITGEAGAGKTTLMCTVLLSLALNNPRTHMQVAMMDPIGQAFGALDNLPHRLAPLAVRPADVTNLLDWLVREVRTRQRTPARQEVHVDQVAIVVAVNAPVELAEVVGQRALDTLTELAQHGKDVRLHLLCSEAHPERLPGALLDQFPVRLVGRVADAATAALAAGQPATSAEGLQGGGDFVAVAGGEVIGFWAAACRGADVARAVSALLDGARPPESRLLPPV